MNTASEDLSYRFELWTHLQTGSEERARFVDSNVAKYVAFQIRAMRASRGWTQEELADRTGMNQNMIYRLENPSYGKPTISTLKRVAAAFDVALIVRFIPFRQLVDWVSSTPSIDNGLSSESLAVPSFADEPSLERKSRSLVRKAYVSRIFAGRRKWTGKQVSAATSNSAQQIPPDFEQSANSITSMSLKMNRAGLRPIGPIQAGREENMIYARQG